MRRMTLSLLVLLIGGCGALSDAGCTTYALQRPSMPTLGDDPVSAWVDVLDGGMTSTCRRTRYVP